MSELHRMGQNVFSVLGLGRSPASFCASAITLPVSTIIFYLPIVLKINDVSFMCLTITDLIGFLVRHKSQLVIFIFWSMGSFLNLYWWRGVEGNFC